LLTQELVVMKRRWARSPRLAGAASAALAAFVVLGACGPAASTTPLGLGPLAVAELQAQPSRRAKPEAPAAKPPSPAPVPNVAEAADTEDDSSEPVVGSESGGDAAPGEPASSPAFEGLYAGVDIAVFRLSGFPEREQRDEKAKIRIEKAAAGSVSITLINSEDGSDLCELTARVDGSAALIESAQPCFSDGGEGSLEALLTSGRAVLSGDQLRMDAEGTLSVALPDQELDGELTYSFKGKRE
jgi:hypothetical protein